MKRMLVGITLTAIVSSSFALGKKKETDMDWICMSDDDARSVYVKYPLRGAAQVQIGAKNLTLATADVGETDDGRDRVRFDFNGVKEAFVIITGGRKESAWTNAYRAGYYDFSDNGGAVKDAVQFICFSAIEK